MNLDVLVLMTSFNRKAKTIECLTKLFTIKNLKIKVVLVDDLSTDGTAEYVGKEFPQVVVINGTGALFWAKGMKLAEKTAKQLGYKSKYVLLLNDDVSLYSDIFVKMYEYAETHSCSMIGPVKDSNTGILSYGGLVKSGLHPLNFKLRENLGQIWTPDVFHANVALIKYADFEDVEGIDDGFAHAYADFDLAMKLKKLNFKVLVFDRIVGTCDSNSFVIRGNLIERFLLLKNQKGRPWKSQYRYLKRHTKSTSIAFIFTLSPYIKTLIFRK